MCICLYVPVQTLPMSTIVSSIASQETIQLSDGELVYSFKATQLKFINRFISEYYELYCLEKDVYCNNTIARESSVDKKK